MRASRAQVTSVQTYIEKLMYNFTGVNYFDVRKHRPLGRILETGREITRQALPIKCVEAVFVATYLTQGVKELERIPMSFKSQVDGVTYKHIVLALKYNGKCVFAAAAIRVGVGWRRGIHHAARRLPGAVVWQRGLEGDSVPSPPLSAVPLPPPLQVGIGGAVASEGAILQGDRVRFPGGALPRV